MEQLKKYYKICDIKAPRDRSRPIIDQVEEHAINVIFTKKQRFLYIRRGEVGVTIKENIIGGGKERNTKKILVIG